MNPIDTPPPAEDQAAPQPDSAKTANSDATTPKAAAEAGQKKTLDLEIKDAQLIFDSVWAELEAERGRENLIFPKEIFWLNGAPGAGKGTQTRFIMQYRYLTAQPIVISDLLGSPEARRLKDAGMMVGDREVTSLFIRRLLEPEARSGVVVDGYPRTKVQVECLKLLYAKLRGLRREFLNTDFEDDFPNPIFHIIVLYVDEGESVRRQLYRGKKAMETRAAAEDADDRADEVEEIRKTDLDEEAARNRYRTFKEVTYESLKSLRAVFQYHFVNAHDSIEQVQDRIVDELAYQSSLELDGSTYDRLANIPVAAELQTHARQDLVKRLDDYERHHGSLFKRVCELIESKFIPIIRRHSISGMAMVNSEDVVFNNNLALAMLIDTLSERGYHAVVDIRREEVADRIDPTTWKIITYQKKVYRFRISFPGCDIRRGR